MEKAPGHLSNLNENILPNLSEQHILGFLPGHTPDENKNVIIMCLILNEYIISSNEDIIVSNKVLNVILIIDKKFKEFNKAVNLFDNNCYIFTKQSGIEFKIPLRFYKDIGRIFEIHQEQQVRQIYDYNENGVLTRRGIIFNGLFTGKIYNKENDSENVKDGFIR